MPKTKPQLGIRPFFSYRALVMVLVSQHPGENLTTLGCLWNECHPERPVTYNQIQRIIHNTIAAGTLHARYEGSRKGWYVYPVTESTPPGHHFLNDHVRRTWERMSESGEKRGLPIGWIHPVKSK